MTAVGQVASLRRYPVKSLVGEDLSRVYVDGRRLSGDRLWSVRDPDGRMLKVITDQSQGDLGVVADVVRAGPVSVGDPVTLDGA